MCCNVFKRALVPEIQDAGVLGHAALVAGLLWGARQAAPEPLRATRIQQQSIQTLSQQSFFPKKTFFQKIWDEPGSRLSLWISHSPINLHICTNLPILFSRICILVNEKVEHEKKESSSQLWIGSTWFCGLKTCLRRVQTMRMRPMRRSRNFFSRQKGEKMPRFHGAF